MRRYTVNCSILFPGTPLLRRPAQARAAGFDAVEFWWPFPSAVPPDRDVDAFVRAVRDAGVRLTGLNFAAGDMAAGERGLVSLPARSREFRDNADVVVGIGEQLGTGMFNALYGNRVAGLAARQQDEVAAGNLAYAAAAAVRIGAVVLLEPLSGAPDYPLRTLDDAAAVVATVDGTRLLADLYHLAVNGDDIPAALARHHARIGHVQVADAPGRGAPGTGTVDLAGHLALLDRLGYDGLVSLEYLPGDGDPFGWLAASART